MAVSPDDLDAPRRLHRDTDELRGFASQLGFDYSPWDGAGLPGVGLPIHRSGADLDVQHVVRGRLDGREVVVFDLGRELDGPWGGSLTCARTSLVSPCASLRIRPLSLAERAAGPLHRSGVRVRGPLGSTFRIDAGSASFAQRVADAVSPWIMERSDEFEYQAGGHHALVITEALPVTRWTTLIERVRRFAACI